MKKQNYLLLLFLFFYNASHASLAWTRVADFGGGAREQAFAFSVGNYGYVGTGLDPSENDDFWQYDPSSDSWSQKANYPGIGRYTLVGFSIGNYGYAGLGWTGSTGSPTQPTDFWQYDPSNNTWTAKANFGGAGRYSAVGFSIGNKGYVGLGYTPLHKDFWEYDPALNSWIQKADFPSLRQAAIGAGVGTKGYVGTGYSNGVSYDDFYEFDPVANTWTPKSNMPGLRRRGAVAFSIDNYIYAGMGYNDTTYLTDFSRYDPSTDQWSEVASIGGVPRYSGIAFACNNYGYAGTGSYGGISIIIPTAGIWRFEDCYGGAVGMRTIGRVNDVYVSVSSETGKGLTINYELNSNTKVLFNLYDVLGKLVMQTELNPDDHSKRISGKLNTDIYFYSVSDNSVILNSGKVIVY